MSKSFALGPVTVTTGPEAISRFALLLWGPSGCGKTTFAATAPGNKLWLSFGDNEHQPIVHRKDVQVADLSTLSLDDLFKHGQNDNPFGLDQVLAKQESIATVVVDSVTALTFRALQRSVSRGIGAGKGFTPTMEAPGISAYGGRNAIVLEVLTGILRVTAKHGVHCIITAHEDDPTTRPDPRTNQEIIEYIGVMLGGKIVNNVTWRLSDIWYMSQSELGAKNRRIAIRPTRLRRPMKTRMFTNKDAPEFDLAYDADKADKAKGQMTLTAWWDEFIKTGNRLSINK